MHKDKGNNYFSNSLIKGLKYLLLGFTIYFVGKTLISHMSQIHWRELKLLTRFVFLSVLFEIGTRFLTGISYNLLLKFAGTPLPLKISISVSWISLLGKYLPGKIALVASSIYLLKRYKVPSAVAGIVPVLFTLITIIVALALSIPLLFSHKSQVIVKMNYNVIVVLVLVIFLLFNLKYFFSILNSIFRRFGILETDINFSFLQVVACFGLICLQFLFAGISTWMVSRSVCPVDLSILPRIISITAFSGVMGLLAFFSPAGIGVRDGIYFITLGRMIGYENASLIVIILRLIQTMIDLGTAGVGALIIYRQKKNDKYKEPPP